MWQKLKRIDVFELNKARIQLINASQLVSAAPRTYINSGKNIRRDWLQWDDKTTSLNSIVFGSKEKVKVTLDLKGFVLSIYGQKDHIEHLVISGITYPMAFGWMRIKLDTFHVEGENYMDKTPYTIANPLGTDDEMNVTDQDVFNELTIYFSNAYFVLKQLEKVLNIHGEISVNPANLQMVLTDVKQTPKLNFGFSPGDEDYPEPYFFIQIEKSTVRPHGMTDDVIGIWNNKNWNGLVYGSGEFSYFDPDLEYNRVMDFFKQNDACLRKWYKLPEC